MVARIVSGQRKSEQRKRGFAAEKQVREILDLLPKVRFEVFHDVKARYGNIDHLVVSREGAVFLIETKSYRGRIAVEDERILVKGEVPKRDVIAQINRNIVWLREKIKRELRVNPWIVAIAVFPNGKIYSAKRKKVLRLPPVKRVNVVSAGYVRRLVESYRPRTDLRQIWNNRHVFAQ